MNRGRMRAALIAGGISPSEETLSALSTGLSTIAHGYHIERVINEAKTETALRKELSQLYEAFRIAASILDADMRGLNQIEVLLSEPLHGKGVRQLLDQLRSLCSHIEMLLAVLAQNIAIRKRRQNPETWFFLAVHDLFARLTGDEAPGIAGPLHRFTKYCAELTDARIVVPKGENSFQKRLAAALRRRT